MNSIPTEHLATVIQLFISRKPISIPKPDLEYIKRKSWWSLKRKIKKIEESVFVEHKDKQFMNRPLTPV